MQRTYWVKKLDEIDKYNRHIKEQKNMLNDIIKYKEEGTILVPVVHNDNLFHDVNMSAEAYLFFWITGGHGFKADNFVSPMFVKGYQYMTFEEYKKVVKNEHCYIETFEEFLKMCKAL